MADGPKVPVAHLLRRLDDNERGCGLLDIQGAAPLDQRRGKFGRLVALQVPLLLLLLEGFNDSGRIAIQPRETVPLVELLVLDLLLVAAELDAAHVPAVAAGLLVVIRRFAEGSAPRSGADCGRLLKLGKGLFDSTPAGSFRIHGRMMLRHRIVPVPHVATALLPPP